MLIMRASQPSASAPVLALGLRRKTELLQDRVVIDAADAHDRPCAARVAPAALLTTLAVRIITPVYPVRQHIPMAPALLLWDAPRRIHGRENGTGHARYLRRR